LAEIKATAKTNNAALGYPSALTSHRNVVVSVLKNLPL